MADDDRDYASHIPVLRSLIRSVQPVNALEFGAGVHSTPCFLESEGLRKLVSVEPMTEWRHRVALLCDDDRLSLRPEPNVTPADFDLILIDDGQCAEERVKTIRFVLSAPHPPTLIHDFDMPEYQATVKELAINHSVYPTDPPTALVWE